MSNWYIRITIYILRLLLVVGLGCYLGAIFEYRNWLKTASWLAKPLVKLGRLPEMCGSAFLTAFVSNAAANSMIAGAHSDGKITRREMILGGIANSYPTKLSHSIRVMFPIIFALGLPAVIYFALNFTGGLIRTIIILLLGRSKHKGSISEAVAPEAKEYTWKETFKLAWKRTRKVMLRVVMITVPLYVLVSYLAKIGFFKTWQKHMPDFLDPYLPPEVMTVIISRLGGLLSAASVAFELHEVGEISSYQIIAAFFMGNVLTNPIRTVRRNLPSAIGIFGKDGLLIVLILQGCRLIFALIVIFVLIYVFN